MSLTPAERSRINRQNARAAKGLPRDTSKTRFNALKHGCRATIASMPEEDPDLIQAREDSWNDFYQPQSPAEQHLVNECVRATILSDRAHRFHDVEVARHYREAPAAREHALADEVERLAALLKHDPAAAVAGIERTALGCRWLIECWERLDAALVTNGRWQPAERDEATRLLGYRSEIAHIKEGGELVWLMRMSNMLLYSGVTAENIAWLCDPAQMPDSLRSTFSPTVLPDKAECLPRLRALAAESLSELRAEAQRLDEEFDLPEREETADRSLLLPEASARVFLRYHAESRVTFQRSYAALMKAIKARDAEDVSDEGSDSPNGAKTTEIATVESAPSGDRGAGIPERSEFGRKSIE